MSQRHWARYRKLALDRLMLSTAKDADLRRHRDLVVGLIVDRLVTPRSKLGFVRAVNPETACTSLGEVLGLGTVAEREVYAALDWLVAQQPRIEAGLARRHLKDGTLVLYDVSSSYFEGRKCPLAQLGYSRDHRSDRAQIVYGLLCTRDGLPVAVEVFEGGIAGPQLGTNGPPAAVDDDGEHDLLQIRAVVLRVSVLPEALAAGASK